MGTAMRESTIEARLVKLVRQRGGLCYKFVSPGNPGVPDRIVITPEGRTVYVELKTPVGRLASLQKWQQAELRKRGADVRTLYGLEAVLAFVEEVLPGEVVHHIDGDKRNNQPENLMAFACQADYAAWHAAHDGGGEAR